jgi:hypothetical protein
MSRLEQVIVVGWQRGLDAAISISEGFLVLEAVTMS